MRTPRKTALHTTWAAAAGLLGVHVARFAFDASAHNALHVMNVAVALLVGYALCAVRALYAETVALHRRRAAALARQAELEQLEQQLLEAPDHAARVRMLEKLAGLETLVLAAGLVLLQACSSAATPAELELEPDAGDAAQQQETQGDAAQQPQQGDPDWLTLVYPHCAGAWADPTDSSTRLVAHPDTGLCTFSCRWLEPKCNESWYADRRCFPVHELELAQLCGELGGSCQLASDGERYCEAAP